MLGPASLLCSWRIVGTHERLLYLTPGAPTTLCLLTFIATPHGVCVAPLSPHCLASFSCFLSPLLCHKPHAVGPLSGPPSGPCLAYTGHMRDICGTNVCCFCLSKIAGLFADAQSLRLGKSHILELLEIVLRATSLSPSQPHGLAW